MLLDTRPQFTRWLELELVMWLNDAQRAIAKYLPGASSLVASMKLAPNTTRQSIAAIPAASLILADGTTPPAFTRCTMLLDVVRNMGADGLTAGAPIRCVPDELMDGIDPNWHNTLGAGSIDHFTYDPRVPVMFYVAPRVSDSIVTWAEVVLAAIPVDVPMSGLPRYGYSLADATVISIGDQYLDDLLNYVMARAHMKDSSFANADKAQMHTQLFVASINTQAQVMTGENPNLSFLPFAPSPLGVAR